MSTPNKVILEVSSQLISAVAELNRELLYLVNKETWIAPEEKDVQFSAVVDEYLNLKTLVNLMSLHLTSVKQELKNE